MKLKRKVVMLPTNEKAAFFISKEHPEFAQKGDNSADNPYWIEQHLYILSDEEIKAGDWCYFVATKEILQAPKGGFPTGAKKIITTTNKLATEPYQGHYNGIDCTHYLPQPSPEFIDKFIREYNKGNVIEEVMVEYNELPVINGYLGEKEYKLKVDKNNYITITKVKDSWNREDVIKLCFKAYNLRTEDNKVRSSDEMNKWIENNL